MQFKLTKIFTSLPVGLSYTLANSLRCWTWPGWRFPILPNRISLLLPSSLTWFANIGFLSGGKVFGFPFDLSSSIRSLIEVRLLGLCGEEWLVPCSVSPWTSCSQGGPNSLSAIRRHWTGVVCHGISVVVNSGGVAGTEVKGVVERRCLGFFFFFFDFFRDFIDSFVDSVENKFNVGW